MEAQKILQSDLLDIIFDGRNKDYGAYSLRRNYHVRLFRALASTFALCIALMLLIWIIPREVPEIKIFTSDHYLGKLPDKILPDLPAVPQTAKSNSKTISKELLKPVVTKNPIEPGIQVLAGVMQPGFISSPGLSGGPQIKGPGVIDLGAIPQQARVDSIFSSPDVEAEYPGGETAWRKHLLDKLDLDLPERNDIPPGIYTVVVRFIVAKDGTVSKVFPETNLGFGLESESVEVIRSSGKWRPGTLNGEPVFSVRRQKIVWVVE